MPDAALAGDDLNRTPTLDDVDRRQRALRAWMNRYDHRTFTHLFDEDLPRRHDATTTTKSKLAPNDYGTLS